MYSKREQVAHGIDIRTQVSEQKKIEKALIGADGDVCYCLYEEESK